MLQDINTILSCKGRNNIKLFTTNNTLYKNIILILNINIMRTPHTYVFSSDKRTV
jgi:hypothetical protein